MVFSEEKAGLNRQSGDRVYPETRWVALLLIPFLIAAWGILYLFPLQTGDLFAWPLSPAMTAFLMGSGYLAGAYFFWQVARRRPWHTVRAGFLPVAIFAGLMLLATLLHWDRFTHDHISFITWAGLYFITPFLVLGLWLRNRRAAPSFWSDHKVWEASQEGAVDGPRFEGGAFVPAGLRWVIGIMGALIVAAGLYFFANPAPMIAAWPWALTPLTTRAILSFMILPAATEVMLALEPRWSAWRTILQGQMLGLVLTLLGVVRAAGDFDWSNPLAYGFVAAMFFFLLLDIAMIVRFERRPAVRRSA